MRMNNSDFWASIKAIINKGFTPESLTKLDCYAEQFISGQLIYKRFSPAEQHGCAKGGLCHVIASILAGAKTEADYDTEGITDFKRELQCGAEQALIIEKWARIVGVWTDDVERNLQSSLGDEIAEGGEAKVYDNGSKLVKSIGLDYFVQPILALDRISLHNAYFPETAITVIGFGRNEDGDFKIIVEQPFIAGKRASDEEIACYMRNMGFELRNPRNWTYSTPEIYLSDMHDENVIKSEAGTFFVVDCDIRINTPQLNQGGIRSLVTEMVFADTQAK
ncbi:hypothetical protein [Bacteroides helcogenes]|uniref:Uncharacterized protein n=1 Tax=Bacteroides helcogenes (strain ATCC 35417 / DSM 20613 / JCM 6297 / CCUG 15421 / P 36-108) TaxID=693979 RepID=E6SVV1_BACT6|nr:hypothetical protein [Bacteroides helcogenes]ADV44540.1 hypothetical protein Bache_2583 [Bacteroides helcogenes P 36-108]MDY5238982.1 hypothetical protein [Bacteroides helcogenes]